NTIHLSFSSPAKNSVLLSYHLSSTNTSNSPWDSNVLLNLPNNLWRRYFMILTALMYTLKILLLFPSPGNTISYCWTKFFINWKTMLSQSTRSNSNGPSKKLIGLDTGSLLPD
ncbi:hypothetical protein ACHAXS_011405, partial [Conticribra weissflogii]